MIFKKYNILNSYLLHYTLLYNSIYNIYCITPQVYLMLALPVGLAALGLYLAAVQPPPPATRPLILDKGKIHF